MDKVNMIIQALSRAAFDRSTTCRFSFAKCFWHLQYQNTFIYFSISHYLHEYDSDLGQFALNTSSTTTTRSSWTLQMLSAGVNIPRFRLGKFEAWIGYDSGYDSETHVFDFRKLCLESRFFPTVSPPRLLQNGCDGSTYRPAGVSSGTTSDVPLPQLRFSQSQPQPEPSYSSSRLVGLGQPLQAACHSHLAS